MNVVNGATSQTYDIPRKFHPIPIYVLWIPDFLSTKLGTLITSSTIVTYYKFPLIKGDKNTAYGDNKCLYIFVCPI